MNIKVFASFFLKKHVESYELLVTPFGAGILGTIEFLDNTQMLNAYDKELNAS